MPAHRRRFVRAERDGSGFHLYPFPFRPSTGTGVHRKPFCG